MEYDEIWENARKKMSPGCTVCKACNGISCRGKVPGIGAKGEGRGFSECVEYLKKIKINIDTIYDYTKTDTSVSFFGIDMKYPIFAAPIGGMATSYGGTMTESEYVKCIIMGMREAGCMAFTGDGEEIEYNAPIEFIGTAKGEFIPTTKPWHSQKLKNRIDLAKGTCAIAMDIDSVAIPLFRQEESYAPPKGINALKEIIDYAQKPFILKGIMTPQGALKAVEAGASAIVVSNHGGRFIEDTPATFEMIEEIKNAIGDRIKIFADGGVRSGEDIFKCLALGADAVLIGRRFSQAVFGNGQEGVKMYAQQLGAELERVMMMTGCEKLSDITRDKIRIKKW